MEQGCSLSLMFCKTFHYFGAGFHQIENDEVDETAEELCDFDPRWEFDAVVVHVGIHHNTEGSGELCQAWTGLDAREEESERERMGDVDSTVKTGGVEGEEAFSYESSRRAIRRCIVDGIVDGIEDLL